MFEGNYFRLLFDGAASISLSALLAALSRSYFSFHVVQETDGVMVLASILLLPSTIIAFGVSSMVFAAYEFVQKRAERKGRREGLQEGRQEGLQEGLQEGRQEGLQEGLQEGRQEGLQEGLQEGRQEESERIERELQALVSNGDGSVTISPEDIKRITRPNRE